MINAHNSCVRLTILLLLVLSIAHADDGKTERMKTLKAALNRAGDDYMERLKAFSEVYPQANSEDEREQLLLAVMDMDEDTGPLMAAMRNDDVDYVKQYLVGKPNIDRSINRNHTLLQYAVLQGCHNIVAFLIEQRASVIPQDMISRRVLDYLDDPKIKRYHEYEKIAALIRRRAEEEFNENERNPAWGYIRVGDNGKLTELLKTDKFNPNLQNRRLESLIFHAVKCDNPEAVNLLLNHGADPSLMDSRHQWPQKFIEETGRTFEQKAEDERLDAMRQKLKSGMAVDAAEPQTGKTALMRACEAGDVAMVYCLVANGAQPRRQDKNGKDAYAYARGYHPESDQLLAILDGAGKEPSAPPPAPAAKAPRRAAPPAPANLDADERDPAWGFIRGGDNAQLAQRLESNKFNPNLQNRSGESLLFCALKAANLEAVKLLVKHGADRDLPDSRGRSPADYVRDMAEVFATNPHAWERYFKPYAAFGTIDYELPESNGMTPLMDACKHGEIVKAKVLISLGADPRKKDKNGKDAYDYARGYHLTSDRMIQALDQAGQIFE